MRPNVYLLIARTCQGFRGIQIIMTKLRFVLLATTALTAMQLIASASHAQNAPLIVAQREELGPDGKPKQRPAPPAAAPPARPAPPAAAPPPPPRPAPPPPPAAAPPRPAPPPPPAAAPPPRPTPPRPTPPPPPPPTAAPSR